MSFFSYYSTVLHLYFLPQKETAFVQFAKGSEFQNMFHELAQYVLLCTCKLCPQGGDTGH